MDKRRLGAAGIAHWGLRGPCSGGGGDPCGFLCAMAPAVEIDGRWAGRATPESVNEMLAGSALQ